MPVKRLLIVLAVFLLFVGCASKPLTNGVITDIGIEDINRFQYYLSARISLTATERVREQNIDRRGTANIRETSFRDRVIIGKNTRGVLMHSRVDDAGLLILEICFEENARDSDKRIIFRQSGPGPERNFFIEYTNPARRLLMYGNMEHSLDTKARERIFLRVRVDKSLIEQNRVRRARGRRVGV